MDSRTKIGRRLSTLELLEPCYWFLVVLAVLVLMRITVSLFVAFFATKITSPLKKQSYLACYCSSGLETRCHGIDWGGKTSAADNHLI